MVESDNFLPKVITIREKPTQKWRVNFLGGKRKTQTENVFSPDGNPIWDYEVTIEQNHVGQVVIPPEKIPPRSTDVHPSHPTKMIISNLQNTHKTLTVTGKIHFWIWVEQFRPAKSGGSQLNLTKLKLKHHGIGSSRSESMSSLNSQQSNQSSRKNRFLRVIGRRHQNSGSTSQNPSESSFKDNDASILGMQSEASLTDHSSYNSQASFGRQSSLFSQTVENPLPSKPNLTRLNEEGNSRRQSPVQLVRLHPDTCSTDGGTEVVVYAVGLTQTVLSRATVLLNGETIDRKDWFYSEALPGSPDMGSIHVTMPVRPAGRYHIELDTMSHGRVRCPQPITYHQARKESVSSVNSRSIQEV